MTKVAIIIPTMNRPDFILRQLRFYELMKSPHPVYISDSSNEENAQKIKDGIKNLKNFEVTYQWAPPGKDCLYQLLPLVKEGYCIQMGDDDIMIPQTMSECADFLESHPDYGTCTGKQVNIRFRKEDYDKPFGLVESQTRPMGRSVEFDDVLVRVKNFWSNTFFICFVVRRTETERMVRHITKNFSFMERVLEFLLVSMLIFSGKSKTLDKLGYVMQINDKRYGFIDGSYIDLILSPEMGKKWKICEDGFSDIIMETGKTREESLKMVKTMFVLYLAHQLGLEAAGLPISYKVIGAPKKNLLKELRHLISGIRFLESIYYKFRPPINDVTRPASRYFNDFQKVKVFLESH